MSISVEIEKDFGSFCLNVAFSAGDETLALLGASGCGKSMTLKCIAGVERPDSGKIIVNGKTLFDRAKRINLSPQDRRTGLLFQNYALFPNMTVLQNITAGAVREKNRSCREQVVEEILERFRLTQLTGHYPHQLSGGQQQRTALARILVSAPQILLLDEPFSALDSHLRFQLEQEVREVIQRFTGTTLLVSHDRDEVFRLSDRIAVLDNGRVDTIGSREEVFSAPSTTQAARLTGYGNISRIQTIGERRVFALDWGVELQIRQNVEDAKAIAIPRSKICSGGKENSVICRVEQEMENPFSYTVMLRPEGAKSETGIAWELDKETWERIRGPKQEICLPAAAIRLLKE
ncbi:MAG: sulfate/molybdate ABC transporter ATP-binding protein [Lawsonibacter sp.]|jgi:molybdate transport system ATP-binding protein